MDRMDVVKTARSWLGTPFHLQARVKGVGIDCIGLIAAVAHELGVTDYDRTDYSTNEDAKREMEETLGRLAVEIPIDEARPGDVLLFSVRDRWLHMAIMSDIGMIHVHTGALKCVETRLDDSWRRRIIKAYKMPGVI